VTCTVTDSNGLTGSCTVTITCCLLPPPTVSITSPADGATVSGTVTGISATATDPGSGIVTVELFVDGRSIGASTGSGTCTAPALDTTLYANGAHAVGAKATNAAGLTACSSVIVTFNNTLDRPGFGFSVSRVSFDPATRVLVCRLKLINTGSATAQAVTIHSFTLMGTTAAGAQATVDATPVGGSFPANLSDVVSSASVTLDVQANVPAEVTSIRRFMFAGQFLFGGNTYYF